MRQHLELSLDLIDESPANPRQTFSDDTVRELAESIRRHGVLIPILVRPQGERFTVVFGARRVRAARLAGLTIIPAMVQPLDDDAAGITAVIENLHRENLTPLDEAFSYQELLTARDGKSLDEVAALCGKSKAYVHQHLALTRLVPEARDLLATQVLPLSYALKLASVPADRQAEGLAHCFSPLFCQDSESRCRELLQPLAILAKWIKDTVRLNPHGKDAQVLLPALAEQVATAEEARRASILTVSDLAHHTDRTEPLPILRKSWMEAEADEDRCRYARPAVIVLGERRDLFLHVCIEKKRCSKHWKRPDASAASGATEGASSRERYPGRRTDDGTSAREEAQREEERERWMTIGRPHALRLLAERTVKLPLSLCLVRTLLELIDADTTALEELVGPIDVLPSTRWPQALAMAVALSNSWRRDAFLSIAEALGIACTERDLTIDVSPVDQGEAPKARSGRRTRREARSSPADTPALAT